MRLQTAPTIENDECGHDPQRPERALIAAILQRSILDMFYAGKSIRRHAKKWIMSDNPTAFSYSWCCDQLEISAPELRDFVMVKSEPFVRSFLEKFHNSAADNSAREEPVLNLRTMPDLYRRVSTLSRSKYQSY